jgi:hypothetical protein
VLVVMAVGLLMLPLHPQALLTNVVVVIVSVMHHVKCHWLAWLWQHLV